MSYVMWHLVKSSLHNCSEDKAHELASAADVQEYKDTYADRQKEREFMKQEEQRQNEKRQAPHQPAYPPSKKLRDQGITLDLASTSSSAMTQSQQHQLARLHNVARANAELFFFVPTCRVVVISSIANDLAYHCCSAVDR